MTEAGPAGQGSPVASSETFEARLASSSRATGPSLLFGLRLWVSVCLALNLAFWLELDNAYWAGATAALVCQPHLGASLRKGWFRMIGTVVGAVAIVVLTACFPQNRVAFLVGLALWGAGCALVATILRNFLALAAQLAGITAAIIASSQLGATGGANGEAFMLAVIRCTEICVGIVCAGVVLAGTDFGSAQRRLAALFAALAAEITGRFTGTLALAGPELPETQPVRRELVRRVIALDPVIDEAIGECAQLRYHSPVLQTVVDGLFAALAGWRTLVVHVVQLPHDQARQEASAVLQTVPQELQSAPVQGEPVRWIADPIRLRRICETAASRLISLPARTLSPAFRTRRLLALTLRGLRRLATGPLPRTPDDWEGRIYGRLSALPDQAQPLQRSQLMAAFSVGSEIIQLRRIGLRLDLGANLDAALDACLPRSTCSAVEWMLQPTWLSPR